jgi:hypothetical protein
MVTFILWAVSVVAAFVGGIFFEKRNAAKVNAALEKVVPELATLKAKAQALIKKL